MANQGPYAGFQNRGALPPTGPRAGPHHTVDGSGANAKGGRPHRPRGRGGKGPSKAANGGNAPMGAFGGANGVGVGMRSAAPPAGPSSRPYGRGESFASGSGSAFSGGQGGQQQQQGRSNSPPPLPEFFPGYPTYSDVAAAAIPGTKPTFRTKQNAFIESRAAQERPGRTLFVRNMKYETNSREVKEQFERLGEIKTYFDLISSRGIAFVTYYDLRAAIFAKERLHGIEVNGRRIDVHFSLPKDEDRNKRAGRDSNHGTLFMSVLNNPRQPINDIHLRAKLEPFGDLRAVIPFQGHAWQRHIEFFDSRACTAAFDALDGSPYLGGSIQMRYSWDLEQPAQQDMPKPASPTGLHPGVPPSVDNRLSEAQKMQNLLASLMAQPTAQAPPPPPPQPQPNVNALLASLVQKPPASAAPPPFAFNGFSPPVSSPQLSLPVPSTSTDSYTPSYSSPFAGYPTFPPSSTSVAPQASTASQPSTFPPAFSMAPSYPPAPLQSPPAQQEPGALPPAILALLRQTTSQQQPEPVPPSGPAAMRPSGGQGNNGYGRTDAGPPPNAPTGPRPRTVPRLGGGGPPAFDFGVPPTGNGVGGPSSLPPNADVQSLLAALAQHHQQQGR